jgi:argininosuccinate lyase
MNNKALWGGRFQSAPDEAMARFSTSLPVDARLWQYDIQGSLAHVAGLEQARVLTSEETAQIQQGLNVIAADIENGTLSFAGAPDEDIHSFIERHLKERIGAVAASCTRAAAATTRSRSMCDCGSKMRLQRRATKCTNCNEDSWRAPKNTLMQYCLVTHTYSARSRSCWRITS